MTRAEIEDRVRALAYSFPPSDFGSARAIKATAKLISDLLAEEQERCVRAIKNQGAT